MLKSQNIERVCTELLNVDKSMGLNIDIFSISSRLASGK